MGGKESGKRKRNCHDFDAHRVKKEKGVVEKKIKGVPIRGG